MRFEAFSFSKKRLPQPPHLLCLPVSLYGEGRRSKKGFFRRGFSSGEWKEGGGEKVVEERADQSEAFSVEGRRADFEVSSSFSSKPFFSQTRKGKEGGKGGYSKRSFWRRLKKKVGRGGKLKCAVSNAVATSIKKSAAQ